MQKQISTLLALSSLFLAATEVARADSVAQIATAVRISRATAAQIDPQGRPDVTSAGTKTAVKKGDVLTFVAAFTPVPNGGYRGLGGYVTVYIPRNTEVVSARIVDRAGHTVAPHRGGLAAEGLGPQGVKNIVGTNDGGSMSQLYADTGIFYSTDPLTNRVPDGSKSGGSELFLLVGNGININPLTTAFTQLDDILGATALYAHNTWDAIQAHAFGTPQSPYSNGSGRGNTLHRFGSPVAGADSFYQYHATYSGNFSPFVYGSLAASGQQGPWRRIQTIGAEIGRIVAHNPPSAMQAPGNAMRVGIPAVSGSSLSGRVLDGANPLPAYNGTDPYTRALRFAVGELVVGQEYFSEFSLRVLDTPLDPVAKADVVCAEVFGGDASAEKADGTKDGKDNAWRYFLPAPACVSLDLLVDLDVSKLVALPGDDLVYTITGKNLTTSTQHNVVVRYCYNGAEETFLSATAGNTRQNSTACPDPAAQSSVAWTIAALSPGQEFSYQLTFDAVQGGNGSSIVARTIYSSQELPLPGFQIPAFTVVGALAVPELTLGVTPNIVPNAAANGTVRYTATVANTGTGVAGCGAGCSLKVTLPDGFTYVPGSLSINGSPVGSNGVQTSNAVTFTQNLTAIPVGGALALSFNVSVPAGTPAGEYTADLEVWLSDVGGQAVNDAVAGQAKLTVNTTQTATPAAPKPPVANDVTVCGVATASSTVRAYIAGILGGSSVADAMGRYCVPVSALTPGQAVSVSAQAAGKTESAHTEEVIVAGFTSGAACDDQLDNDGDGKTDFPDDLGCTSKTDADEGALAQCADGIDQDMDGKVDLADEGCSSLFDDAEGGQPACSDGQDNDGDGQTDSADRGCTSSDDSSELDVSACSDGMDNDADNLKDFPLDPGCESAADNDETNSASTPGGGGSTTGGSSGGVAGTNGGGAGGAGGSSSSGGGAGGGANGDSGPGGAGGPGSAGGDAGVIDDLGGVDPPKDAGCSVRHTGDVGDRGGWLLAMLGLTSFLRRLRKQRHR